MEGETEGALGRPKKAAVHLILPRLRALRADAGQSVRSAFKSPANQSSEPDTEQARWPRSYQDARRSRARAAALGAAFAPGALPAFADGETETYGLSSFGDLALPADFKHYAYVNPSAPKAGVLSIQITSTGGNQNFDTFDTLNIFSTKGDGAAGMSECFDTLMTGHGDEPDSVYGLLASSVRYSADKLAYRFTLRPEAKFADGSKVTAADVAFSLDTLKTKGHPIYARVARAKWRASQAEERERRQRCASSRSAAAMLI